MTETTSMPQFIRQVLKSEVFEAAWKECDGVGAGTRSNLERIYRRLWASEFHRERIDHACRNILRGTDPLLRPDITKEDVQPVYEQTLSEVLAACSAYTITGLLVGLVWSFLLRDEKLVFDEEESET